MVPAPKTKPLRQFLAGIVIAVAVLAAIVAGAWYGLGRMEHGKEWQRLIREEAGRKPAPPVKLPPPEAPVTPQSPASPLRRESSGDIQLRWNRPVLAKGGGEPERIEFSKEILNSVPHLEDDLAGMLKRASDKDFKGALAVVEGIARQAGGWQDPALSRLRELVMLTWGAHLLYKEKYAQAILVFLDLEEINPTDRSYELPLGIAYGRIADKEKSWTYLKRFADREGVDERFAYELGELAYFRNDLKDAVAYLKIAKKGSRKEDAEDFLRRIDKESFVEEGFREIVGYDEGNFRVVFDGAQNAEAAYGTRVILEQARRDEGRILGFLPEDKITAVLYTRVQYNRALNAPDWSGALYDGKIRLPTQGLGSSALPLKDTIYHEYAHAVIHRMGGDYVTSWLHEGLAQMLEPGSRGYRYQDYPIDQRGYISLIKIEPGVALLNGPAVHAAYGVSQSFVGYLIQEHGGYRKIRQLLACFKEGMDSQSAVPKTYGLERDVLERRWREIVERNVRK